MKIKRIGAYIIDFALVFFLSSIIFCLPIFKNNYNAYENATLEYVEYITELGSSDPDQDIELDLIHNLSKQGQPLTIINCGLLLLYFGIFAYINKGQTLGKKIFKIKVVSQNSDKLNPNLFMLRAIILTNLIPKIVSIIALATLSKTNWLMVENLTSSISTTMLFLMVGFMIFREDERSLHDCITKTEVIETK